MKLIIAGSRSLDMMSLYDKRARQEKLENMLKLIDELVDLSQGSFFEWKPVTEVVSGKAAGPDTVGEIWAMRRGLRVKSFPANWLEHGKLAGFIRNAEMAEYADHGILLWDGKSRGTLDMDEQMSMRDKECIVHNYRESEVFDKLMHISL